jgi:hypothetical protein
MKRTLATSPRLGHLGQSACLVLRRARRPGSLLLLATVALLATACRYRPAKFGDHPPVVKVGDDMPIPVPENAVFDELLHVSDVYLRRPAYDALSPVDPPDALDVNSLDEVPASSWFLPPRQLSEILADREADFPGPPVLPLTLLDESPAVSPGRALVVRDARGARYELLRDNARRPELLTGAAAVGSRFLRALGQRTPDVWVLELPSKDVVEAKLPESAEATDDQPAAHTEEPPKEESPAQKEQQERAERARIAGRQARIDSFFAGEPRLAAGAFRISATRFPNGIDVGITPDFGTRADDDNDRIAHNDRRTLRALSVYGSLLAFDGFGVRRTRDVYVGPRGKGHLLHYVVRMEQSLGATSVVDPLPPYHPFSGKRGDGTLANLLLLGFAPAPRPHATQRKFLALGSMGPLANPEGMDTSVPYGPFVRLSRTDGYWAAKRIASVLETPSTLFKIVEAADFSDRKASEELLFLLRLRARQVVGYWMHQVTPIEFLATEDRRIVLRDAAIFGGYAPAAEVHYELTYLDAEGHVLWPTTKVQATDGTFVVEVPKALLDPERPAVLHIRSFRRSLAAPAYCDLHLAFYVGGVRVYAVTH